MKLLMVALKDALKGYAGINLVDNEPVALRDFSNAVNSNEIISRNLGDYSLYKLGEYDTEKGTIDTKGCPVLIASASDVKDGAKRV